MRSKLLRALLLFVFSAAASQATAAILETDYVNPSFDQTLNPKWASNLCDGRRFLDNRTPLFEWTPVFGSEVEKQNQLVGFSGTLVEEPQYSQADVWFTHPFGFDWEFHIAPDQPYAALLAPSNGCTSFNGSPVCMDSNGTTMVPQNVCLNSIVPKVDDEVLCAVLDAHAEQVPLPMSPLGVLGVLGIETDQGLVPPDYRARVHKGDRIAVFGRWIADCGHTDFHTEVHPPLLMTFARQIDGVAGQPVTFYEVISRPYLVSQTFEDRRGVRHHLFNELLKGIAIPNCPPVNIIVDAALDESGGCTVDVCDPILNLCIATYCQLPAVPLWFHVPCTTRFEAHPRFKPKPFADVQTMSYIIRPPVPRQCKDHKLLVSSHFTVRHGVTAAIAPFIPDPAQVTIDAARVTITMDESQYTAPPLPPKADMSLSLDDIRHFDDGTADLLVLIRDVLLGLAADIPGVVSVGPLFTAILARGLLTDCYDPSYGTLGNSTFPECGALTPLMATSPVDTQHVVVRTPIEQLAEPIFAEDNSNGQPFPIYGSAAVEWSQEKFPPAITITQPAAIQYVHSAALQLQYTVTDTGCGVRSVTPRMDGMTTIGGHGLESGQVINLLTELTTGDHTFTVEAADHVGGTSMASVTFTIIVTPESIEDDVN